MLGLVASDVVEALNRDNLDTPAGRVRASGRDISLRVDNRLGNISDFNSLVVASRAGRSILLADVATVRDGAEERSSLALVNGTPALAIEVTAARGANAWWPPPRQSRRHWPRCRRPCRPAPA